MAHEQFIKVVNHNLYLNPRYIVALDFDEGSEIGKAAIFSGNVWIYEEVYKKDIEHLITKEL